MKNKAKTSVKIAVFGSILSIFPILTYASSPTLSFTVSPQEVIEGQAVAISWYSQNAEFCEASGGWAGYFSTRSSGNVFPKETTTYYITCTGPEGTISDAKTVFVTKKSTINGSSIIISNPPPTSYNYLIPAPTPTYTPPAPAIYTAACAANPTVAEVGKNVHFAAAQNAGIAPFSYRWGGDISGISANETVAFQTTGQKTARITIIDSRGMAAEGLCGVNVIPAGIAATSNTKTPSQTVKKSEEKVVASPAPKGQSFLASLFSSGASTKFLIIFLLPVVAALSLIVIGYSVVKFNARKKALRQLADKNQLITNA